MAELVEEEDLPKLQNFLYHHLPGSSYVYDVVRRISEGYNPGFLVWSCKASDYSVVAVTADKNKCQNPHYREKVFMFSTDQSKITNVLRSPGVLNYNERIFFYGILQSNMDYISSIPIWSQYEIREDLTGHAYWCYDKIDIPILSAPDGFVSSVVSEEALQTLKVHIGNSEASQKAVGEWLHWKFPSVCLYDSDENPVAWMLQKYWGSIGSLYVLEPYRRKGLGKYVASELARTVIQRDGSVRTCILEDNDRSANLHQAIGFKKLKDAPMSWRCYHPKYDT